MTHKWGQMLLGFDGRANRAKFWLLPLVPFLLLFVFAVIAVIVLETFVGRGAGPALALILVGTPLVLLYVVIAASVTVRRLHDREMPGSWAWLFLGVPYLLLGLSALLPEGGPGRVAFTVIQVLISVAILGISIWYLVVCGFLRGTYGPNRYGPDPLDPERRGIEEEADEVRAPVRPSRPPRPSGPPRSARVSDVPPAMQGVLHTLFSFRGRLNRAPYWGWGILLGVLSTVAFLGIAGGLGWLTPTGIEPGNARLILIPLSLLTLWPNLALVVKRLNDRDRPAWLAVPIFVPSWLSLLFSSNVGQFRFDTSMTSPLELVLSLLTILAVVYSFIELGCLRGTIGDNGHGPDPLAGKGHRRAAQPREA